MDEDIMIAILVSLHLPAGAETRGPGLGVRLFARVWLPSRAPTQYSLLGVQVNYWPLASPQLQPASIGLVAAKGIGKCLMPA